MSTAQKKALKTRIRAAIRASKSGFTAKMLATRLNSPYEWITICLGEMRKERQLNVTKRGIYLTAVLNKIA